MTKRGFQLSFRFSLRVVLIVITGVAIWLAYETRRIRIRREAVAAVLAVEGNVKYQDSTAARYLIPLIGADYFSSIERVSGLYRKMNDDHLEALSRIPELKHITTNHAWAGSLIGTFAVSGGGGTGKNALITDEGMAHLSKAKSLESLILFNTKVTDKGVAHLGSLQHLEYLSISSTHITDASVPTLSKLKSLKRLWTTGTSITSEGADRLRQALPHCEVISIDDGTF